MGCDSYTVQGWDDDGSKGPWKYSELRWTEATIKFSEADEREACLCTMKSNDNYNVRSMALIGAMVVLAHQGQFNLSERGGYLYIPHDLPPDVLAAIDAVLPRSGDDMEGR